MKLFILDDDFRRIRSFKYINESHFIVDVSTLEDAWRSLSVSVLTGGFKFDYVFLDHDLEPQDYERQLVSYEEYKRMGAISGGILANRIADCAEAFGDTKFIIHSLNEAGSLYMLKTLQSKGLDATIIKFAWEKPVEVLFQK